MLLPHLITLWIPQVDVDVETLEVQQMPYQRAEQHVPCYIEPMLPNDTMLVLGDPNLRACRVMIDGTSVAAHTKDNYLIKDETTSEIWVWRGEPQVFRGGSLPHIEGVVSYVEVPTSEVA